MLGIEPRAVQIGSPSPIPIHPRAKGEARAGVEPASPRLQDRVPNHLATGPLNLLLVPPVGFEPTRPASRRF